MNNPPLNRTLKVRAGSLRKGMTPEEKKLWYQYLRSYPVKFRRQQIQAPFILDFYCHQARLAIEIDGSQHYTDYGRSYDQWRTKHIEKEGIAVLRFSNSDIRHRFDGVRIMIDLIVKKRVEELKENQS